MSKYNHELKCYCLDCRHNDNGECDSERVTISNDEMTPAGFYPICQEYEERRQEQNNGTKID